MASSSSPALINTLENEVGVEMLIKNGAQIPEKAITLAAFKGRNTHFLSSKIKIDVEKMLYWIPHSIIGNKRIVEILVENGVNTNDINSDGESAIIKAATKGESFSLRKTNICSAKRNEWNWKFNVIGDISTMKLLIEHGANVNAVNNKSQSGQFVT